MTLFTKDTIAAIATAPVAGCRCDRISGADLKPLARRLSASCRCRVMRLTPTQGGGRGSAGSGVWRSISPAPVRLPVRMLGCRAWRAGDHAAVVAALRQKLGARLAEPGVTKRAFLNDKLDLAQAEAVADLIDASSGQAARSAVRSLQGVFDRGACAGRTVDQSAHAGGSDARLPEETSISSSRQCGRQEWKASASS